MTYIKDLANFYKNDLIHCLRYMLKPDRKRTFEGDKIYNVFLNDLVTDSYEQLYDIKDRSKIFKFHVKQNLSEGLVLTKVFKVNGYFNDLDYPSFIHLSALHNIISFGWYQQNKLHRLNGPASISYDIDKDEITHTDWVIDGSYLKPDKINSWLGSNGYCSRTPIIDKEHALLLKLQANSLIES